MEAGEAPEGRWLDLATWLRRTGRSLVAAIAMAGLLASLPATAIANAAEPITLADWLRTIFVTPDRELDASQQGVAVSPPPPPSVVVQTSSERIPPEQPVVRNRVPDGWLRDDRQRDAKRRRPPLV